MRLRVLSWAVVGWLAAWGTVELGLAQRPERGGDGGRDAAAAGREAEKPEQKPESGAEAVFSGPQVDELLPDMQIRGVFDAAAGQEFKLWKEAGKRPVLVIFVHPPLTRPAVAVVRTLGEYAERQGDAVYASVVFLGSDATGLEQQLKRARHALPKKLLVGISPDGQEGPGAYGLNRNVSLTVLLADGSRRVVANSALVQPSVQADAPRIAGQLAKLLGKPAPRVADLGVGARMRAGGNQAAGELDLRSLLGPVIRKQATPNEVAEAVRKAERVLAENAQARARVGDIARRIIEAGKLENYGTPAAQETLKRWAKEYGSPADPPADQAPAGAKRSTGEAPDTPREKR